MTLSRWMLVALWWARWLVNASVTAVMSTAVAALFFPQFPATTAWPWKAGAGLAIAATLAYAQPPTPHPGWAGPTAAAAGHLGELPIVNVYLALDSARRGDRDDTIPLIRAGVDHLFRQGHLLGWGIPATGVLVETQLDRGADDDVAEAEAAIQRFAAAPADEGLVIREIWLAVGGQAKELGCQLDTLETEQLWNACRLRDAIAGMEDRLAGADLMIPGSREQWVAHPLLVQIRLHRQLLSQTLARLRFPEEESAAAPAVRRSTAARAAANVRWRRERIVIRTRNTQGAWRDMPTAHWDAKMTYWRIDGHAYPYEQALKSGGDVVVDSGRLADALAHAGQAAGRFADDGADAGRVWLLGADDRLTLIEDHHVADMSQRDFDALVEGLGASRWRDGDACDPHATVERHADWTAAIRARIG